MSVVLLILAFFGWLIINHALNVRHRNGIWKQMDARREREEKRKKEGREL